MGTCSESPSERQNVHTERYRLRHTHALYLIDENVYSVELRGSIAKRGTEESRSLPFPALELPVEVRVVAEADLEGNLQDRFVSLL
jgi:hypothetical protein